MHREELMERLSYDKMTGIFLWKAKTVVNRYDSAWNTKYAGKEAGTVKKADKLGNLFYRVINIDGKLYRAHRLAFIYEGLELPAIIDHIDGNGLNNRIENLRELPQRLNCLKGRKPVNNSSGVKGVSYRKDVGKWSARISDGKRYKSLGVFESLEKATEAVENARSKRLLG